MKLGFLCGIFGTIVIACGVLYYFMLARQFDMAEVKKLPAGTQYFDRHGQEIEVSGAASRKLVKREDIPDFLVLSLRAREDARFFEHGGVDVRGLARATVRNLKDRSFTQGASTLSMQLARNCFKMKQKSLHRKFLEIALTLRLEAHYTKDEILTNYLNRIYFGAGADGIEQAAQTYFGKSTRELSKGECALIVGIIRGPHIFSPLRNLPAALEQRRQTLNRLVAMKAIDRAESDRIANEPVHLAADSTESNQTSYAMQAVRRALDRWLELDGSAISGLKVYTTLDMGWQTRVEQELTHAVEALESETSWQHTSIAEHTSNSEPTYLQYAAVTTKTTTGEVLALIGGRDFRHSRFDRTRSSRDLGSAFEPFVAAAAAERGKLVLPGRPMQTGRQIGPAEVERIAKRCGFDGPFLKTEDLFRGSVAATPLEMSIGLATLGNRGKRPEPIFIREIRNAASEKIYQMKPFLNAALSSQAADEALSVLKSSNSTRNFVGATGSERDAWMMRLGPSGATAVWIGFDQPRAIAKEKRLNSLLDEFVTRLGKQ